MSYSRRPRVDTASRVTIPLRDLALDEREHAYYGPRMGDWLLLGFVVVGLLANGLYVWHQLGPANDHTGRAIFFGLALLAALWATLVFSFKLSVCVRVGAHGMSIVRGPWHTELAWAQVARLVERVQVVNQRRLRWVVAVARDGRSLQVREDMVTDYGAFRVEVWERYRLWRDHGGTWGATGGGPFTARETASSQTTWWIVLGLAALLPGLYCSLVLTELGLVGPILVVAAVVCALFALRAVLRRRSYVIDAKGIQCKQFLRTTRVAWRDIKKVERTRRSFGGMMEMGIRLGRAMLSLAARGDGRVESFDWSPRVPEYLTLRGAGRQVRIRLHRLARPDEALAWVEFYERAGRHLAEMHDARRTVPPGARMPTGLPAPTSLPDLAGKAITSRPAPEAQSTAKIGPVDPWAAGRDGTPEPGREERAPTAGPAAASGTTGERAEPAASDEPRKAPEPPGDQWSPPEWHAQPPQEQEPAQPAQVKSVHLSPLPPLSRGAGEHQQRQPSYPDQSGQQPDQASQPVWQGPAVPSVSEQPWRPAKDELAHGVADEASPEAAEDAPTGAVEPLADAFKVWGTQAGTEHPRFPRFGPPLSEESAGTPDAGQFERDDFLR